jgi:hypothetical protein
MLFVNTERHISFTRTGERKSQKQKATNARVRIYCLVLNGASDKKNERVRMHHFVKEYVGK